MYLYLWSWHLSSHLPPSKSWTLCLYSDIVHLQPRHPIGVAVREARILFTPDLIRHQGSLGSRCLLRWKTCWNPTASFSNLQIFTSMGWFGMPMWGYGWGNLKQPETTVSKNSEVEDVRIHSKTRRQKYRPACNSSLQLTQHIFWILQFSQANIMTILIHFDPFCHAKTYFVHRCDRSTILLIHPLNPSLQSWPYNTKANGRPVEPTTATTATTMGIDPQRYIQLMAVTTTAP